MVSFEGAKILYLSTMPGMGEWNLPGGGGGGMDEEKIERSLMQRLLSHGDSTRQKENESEKGTFVSHALDLFSSHLVALGNMLVNHS